MEEVNNINKIRPKNTYVTREIKKK